MDGGDDGDDDDGDSSGDDADDEDENEEDEEVGYGIRGIWIDPAETVPEIAPMIVGEVNNRVTELVELYEHDTQDLYALLEAELLALHEQPRRAGQPGGDTRVPNHQDAPRDADSHI
nr:hypothetical protein [Tanacetum cinerariifolium]